MLYINLKDEKMTSKELQELMSNYYGTEHYYTTMFPHVFYTDGVKAFCDAANAYWFLTDALLVTNNIFAKSDGFIAVKLKVADGKADVEYTDGNTKVYKTEHYEYTDCPDGDWTFFFELSSLDGVNEDWVMLWHSEH